jgi:oxygen-independent coproporphyrinogen-3 oxidase
MAGLYLHIPFCDHKCIYCDFYSLPSAGDARDNASRIRRFVQNLQREIDLRSGEMPLEPVDTVFFGGGTPSLLQPDEVEGIVRLLKTQFTVDESAEVTLESNPGTVDQGKLRAFKDAGVNRLSIGVQSFYDRDLRFLTRIHSGSEAARTVEDAHAAGFSNVNIDLMFGLPGQTTERWAGNLQQAADLSPSHLSCYSLTVEPNTVLAKLVASRQVSPVSQELDADLYEQTAHVLARYGFKQYEVSNFALDGYQCRHNLTYWNHAEYLGFGPSAHSFLGDRRWWNVRSVSAYGDALEQGLLPVAGEEQLSPEQLMMEEIFLGLRSTGIDLNGFCARHRRLLPGRFQQRMDDLLKRNLASTDGQRLWLTTKGYLICDELCASLAA